MHRRNLALTLLLCAATARAAVTLQAYGEIPAAARDTLGDTLGGLGSAVAYDAQTGCVFLMPDRGAGDGKIDYRPRCHRLRLAPDPKDPRRLDWRLEETLVFRDAAGRPFTGRLADTAHAPTYRGRRCLDPEALAVASDGTLYVSDEYGPALLHFDRAGRLLRELALPDWFLPRDARGALDYRPEPRQNSGRAANQGAEAMGLLPDGKHAVLLFQSALVQDGGRPAGTARVLVLDLRTGRPTAEYAYAFGPARAKFRDLSVNDLAVVDAHTLLVLERDGLGRDGPPDPSLAREKAVWLVDLRGATNLLSLRGRPYDRSPADPAFRPLAREAEVKFVRKTLLFNLPDLLPQLGLPVARLAAKWEGLALLPPSSKRQFHLLLTADNDFLSPELTFGGRTTRFPRARDAVPTQFFEILATRP